MMVTTLADIARLRAIAVELDEMRQRNAHRIANEFIRDDLMREAMDRISWTAGEALRAAIVWMWAIREAAKGEES